jgi:chromosome condensin MukBEF ATPase and DNA-binding subunit MukB
MTKRKKMLVLASASLLSLSGALGLASTVQAATNTRPEIITELAQKFNLNVDEVAKFFEEKREQRQDKRLDKLVTDKVISSTQREALEKKQDEIRTKIEEIRNSNKTDAEKRKAIRDLRNEMQDWLDDNNIELRGGMPGKPGHGMGGLN